MVLIAACFRISQLNTWLFTVRVPLFSLFPNKWSDLEGEEWDRNQPAEEITDRKASRSCRSGESAL